MSRYYCDAWHAYGPQQSIDGLLNFVGAMGPKNSAVLCSAVLCSNSRQTGSVKPYLSSKKPGAEFADNGHNALNPDYAKLLLGVVALDTPNSALGVSLYQRRGFDLGLKGCCCRLRIPHSRAPTISRSRSGCKSVT
ncbi:hypothetical protein V4C53_40305 [Paraburkholderia azotifigens]|uniref:hypothetical protein n=1 Tax=Paraburkholderia azotifigens TaxID=2057004 RepID=UPI00317B46CB